METAFGRWIRNHPRLDSGDGFAFVDQDYWCHQFKTHSQGRDFQLIMGIEIKTRQGSLSASQRDTLYIVNQLMRNRRETPTKKLKFQSGSASLKVHSIVANRSVNVKCFGIHLLQFSGMGPSDSDWMKWDGDMINEDQLVQLLRFDLDPDTLNPVDLRSHHVQKEMPLLTNA